MEIVQESNFCTIKKILLLYSMSCQDYCSISYLRKTSSDHGGTTNHYCSCGVLFQQHEAIKNLTSKPDGRKHLEHTMRLCIEGSDVSP